MNPGFQNWRGRVRWTVLAAGAVITLPFLQCATAQGQRRGEGAAPAANIGDGRAAFANTCSVCHGEQGEGAMGPKIAGTALTLADFLSRVRMGKGAMPPFDSATVPDAQAANIYEFLKSLPASSGASGVAPNENSARGDPNSTTVAFAPAAPGNADRGKTLFMSDGCYECHGRVGQGAAQTQAPRIGPAPIPVAAFAAYIRHPTNNMPPYSAKVVPDQDVADIYAYLQTIKAPTPAKDIPLLNQ